MKNISQTNKNRLIAVLFVFSLHAPVDAQIADFIVNQIEDYISGQVNSVLHSTESYLGSWGTSIWESVVASKAESDLKKKAEEFKNFEPEKVELKDLENRYSAYARVTPYTSIYSQNADYIQSLIHAKNNIMLKNLGKGAVEGCIESLEKEIQGKTEIHNLIDVLSSTVLDSINHYSISANNLEKCLLSDIQRDYRLSELLNNHPSAVKVYCNSIHAPSLRGDTRHLLYWTEQADSHRPLLSRKAKLLNPKQICFEEDDKCRIRISYNGQTLGYIDGYQIICENIELLNLQARPNTSYSYNNTIYSTDALGRIVSTKQKISTTNKRKCNKKSLIKKKEYIAVHGSKSVQQPFSIALIEYGAPDVLQNNFFYEKTASNKVVAKEMKRFYKQACKLYNEIETQLEYNDCGLIPCGISINGVKNRLENISIFPL